MKSWDQEALVSGCPSFLRLGVVKRRSTEIRAGAGRMCLKFPVAVGEGPGGWSLNANARWSNFSRLMITLSTTQLFRSVSTCRVLSFGQPRIFYQTTSRTHPTPRPPRSTISSVFSSVHCCIVGLSIKWNECFIPQILSYSTTVSLRGEFETIYDIVWKHIYPLDNGRS